MATASLSLPGVNASGAVTLVDYQARNSGGMTAEYVGTNNDDSLAAPRVIDVKLFIKPPGLIGNDRAEVSIKQTVLDSENLPHTGSVTVKLSVPRTTAWNMGNTVSLLKQMASYLSGEGQAQAGETNTNGFPAMWAEMLIP